MENEKLKPLEELCEAYFSKKYQYKKLTEKVRGRSGQKWTFDAIIESGGHKFALVIKDWNRRCGINQVRQLEKICKDTPCDGGVLISNNYSGSARMYGERCGIQTIARYELEKKIRF